MEAVIEAPNTKRYNSTVLGCFVGIINQAVMSSITAVLFVTLMNLYGLSLWQFGVLVGINFAVQTVADIILTVCIDRISFRPIIIIACVVSALGLVLFALVPYLFVGNIYMGIIVATIVFSSASGMLEVIVSPIIDNIPETYSHKGKLMSVMHSFYAWGQIFCIVITAVYLMFTPDSVWNFVLLGFAIVPIIALIIFLKCPLDKKVIEKQPGSIKKMALSGFFLLALAAIALGGATEVTMNQWTSTFLVTGFGLSKATADLLGMCLFAMCLGIGRTLYGKFGDKVNMHKVLVIGSLASVVLYLIVGFVPSPIIALIACVLTGLSASLLWPGTLVVSSTRFPTAGAWLFAVLAVTGDIGAAIVPTVTGFLAESIGLQSSFAILAVVPALAFVCHLIMYRISRKPHSMTDSLLKDKKEP